MYKDAEPEDGYTGMRKSPWVPGLTKMRARGNGANSGYKGLAVDMVTGSQW